MKKFFIGAAALMAILLMSNISTASAQSQSPFIPTVSVNGSAEVKVTPDEIYISIRLDESDTKGRVTLEEQRRQMFTALKKCGIDAEKQLTMQDMGSEFFRRRGSLTATQYELKVASAAEVAEVFEALDRAGIANVNVDRTACSRLEEYRTEARQKAILNAQRRASELAEAVGQSIGYCYEISDYTSDVQNHGSRRVMMTKSAMDSAAVAESLPEVEFEQTTITYNLSAKFYLHTNNVEQAHSEN